MTRLRFQIASATFARVVLNTAHRMVYPFLPAISRGLGVPLESLTYVLSVRAALGMTSPFFSSIPDRFGRKVAMLLGIGIFCAAMIAFGLLPTYAVFFAAIVAVVVAKFIFDPALQAYIGDRTPYSQRGFVIAVTEIGWSGAALIGFPLVGLMIERWGWRSPFLPLAGLGLLGGAAIWFLIPGRAPVANDQPSVISHQSSVINQQSTIHNPQSNWAAVWASPRVLAALSIGFWISAANEALNVVFGDWMETTFGLTVAALGLSTTVIGLADLAGEGLVMVPDDDRDRPASARRDDERQRGLSRRRPYARRTARRLLVSLRLWLEHGAGGNAESDRVGDRGGGGEGRKEQIAAEGCDILLLEGLRRWRKLSLLNYQRRSTSPHRGSPKRPGGHWPRFW